ncbi:MAG: dihydropteroate synthase [Candidatus Micrarchaeaceae archaeon]
MVKLVGILNVTPDSFSDGNLYLEPAKAIHQADKLFKDGASLVDVGAESTRPGAIPLSWHEEWERLEPVLPKLLSKYSGRISLDTYHAETAKRALALSPKVIINDVTGLSDPGMVDVIVSHQARCIIGHVPGGDAQDAHVSTLLDDVSKVKEDLLAKAESLEKKGLSKDRIILDPGIGFGKTPRLNSELLEFPKLIPDYEVMIGYSRKRFLGDDRMERGPNLEAGKIAAAAGAAYLRVHDVDGHKQLLY